MLTTNTIDMRSFICLLFASILLACNPSTPSSEESANVFIEENPPCEGFNLEGSDEKAIQIADEVMQAMGGRKAWDDTRYITWSFFGRRDLCWDKLSGNVRIESPGDSSLFLLNINTMEGKAFKNGMEVTDSDSKSKLLERAKSIWINDSYWLVMPFKLKDSGVTLTYQREDTTLLGANADVLQLTFAGVGVTPQNKYEVWVDQKDRLIKQWAYYRDAAQDSASSIWPFDNYEKYGEILLSANRSDGRGPKGVAVSSAIDESIFTNPAAKMRN